MKAASSRPKGHSFSELTRAVFGEALNMREVLAVLEAPSARPVSRHTTRPEAVWVGSVGYERYNDNRDFARRLRDADVEVLVDVRELPISRRRGYAKTALGEAMAAVGIEYVHRRALGNPKAFRDLYKSGRVDEGRALYERHLLAKRRDDLEDLVVLLRGKRAALVCVEHDPSTCHRTVILEALQSELAIELDIAELG